MKDYVIGLNEKTLVYFYYANNKIFSSTYDNGIWTKAKLVADNVMETFSFCLSPSNNFNIFYQDMEANVTLLTNENDNWEKKIILYNNDSQEKMLLHFSSLYIDNIFYIFFIQKNGSTKNLVSQQLLDNQKWSNPQVVGKNILGTNELYSIYNNLITYCSVNENLSYGYISLTESGFSTFTPLFKTKQTIVDKSIILIKDTFHVVFCIKGLFSYQLVYKKICNGEETMNKIIYEGQKIRNPIIFSANERLYISYIFNNSIYYTYSNDFGDKFEKVIKNRNNYTNLKKAIYVKNYENGYIASEMYCNNKNKIILIDEVHDDFYSHFKPDLLEVCDEKKDNIKTEIEEDEALKKEILKYSQIIDENNKKYNEYIEKVNNHIRILEEKNTALLNEINNLHLQLQQANN